MIDSGFTKTVLATAKNIRDEVHQIILPPSNVTASPDQPVLPTALFSKCQRSYIQKVVIQINRAYSETCYDACAVMIRRLIETFIIEVFEHHHIDNLIKKPTGEFFFLEDLINAIANEKSWNIGRNAKKALDKFKRIGDWSAHNRRWNAHREYIDEIKDDLRISCHELLVLAKMDQ